MFNNLGTEEQSTQTKISAFRQFLRHIHSVTIVIRYITYETYKESTYKETSTQNDTH